MTPPKAWLPNPGKEANLDCFEYAGDATVYDLGLGQDMSDSFTKIRSRGEIDFLERWISR